MIGYFVAIWLMVVAAVQIEGPIAVVEPPTLTDSVPTPAPALTQRDSTPRALPQPASAPRTLPCRVELAPGQVCVQVVRQAITYAWAQDNEWVPVGQGPPVGARLAVYRQVTVAGITYWLTFGGAIPIDSVVQVTN